MTGGLKPYPAYKDSGVPWLGSIPADWEVWRNGRLFAQRNEIGFGHLPILEVSLKTGVRVRDFDEAARKQVLSDKDKYKLARRGDLAYNMMRLWQGAAGIAPVDGLVSPAYVVAVPLADTNARYFEHLFRTDSYKAEVNKFSRGIVADRNRLYWEDFKQMPSPVPPSEDQAAIVRFLSHLDHLVARYIRAKQKLIALLNEQKQAIIHRAVTRGLDPNVRLKPSGVEWLGDVPERWDLRRLKTLLVRVTSGSRGWSHLAADDGPLFLRVGNLTRTSIDLNLNDTVRLNLSRAAGAEGDRTKACAGDLLLSITAYIGSVAVVPPGLGEAYVSQHVACCRLTEGVANVKWLAYVLLSPVGQTHGRLCMYGGTKQGLSLNDVKNYVVLLPPKAEQDVLVSAIERNTRSLNSALGQARSEVSLLREYRTRLIADVVTGKLDVREATARLPQEGAREPEAVEPDEMADENADDAGAEGEGEQSEGSA